jgi:hypothetical protein
MIDPINQGHGRSVGKKTVKEMTKPREQDDVHKDYDDKQGNFNQIK